MGQIVVVVVGRGIVAAAAALPMRCQFENAMKNSKSRERARTVKSPSMPDWRTLHLQRYERCRGGGQVRRGAGVRGVANASLTNATRRCVCCMRVSVCVCIYNKAKQRTGRNAERWGEREMGLWERSHLQWLLSLTAKFMWLFMHFN